MKNHLFRCIRSDDNNFAQAEVNLTDTPQTEIEEVRKALTVIAMAMLHLVSRQA
jgi:hypothetical protein